MYLTLEEYTAMGGTVSDNTNSLLERAENDVNSLTFCRINSIGFNNLTQFQQKTIKKVIFYHIAFLQEYKEVINSPLASYSINGVSMNFDKSAYIEQSGVKMLANCYSLLMQTGLTYQGVK